VQWLGAFFAAFPALKSKKIHLLGESYAGIFVCYESTAEIDTEAD
jgi:carboxypeptidase D